MSRDYPQDIGREAWCMRWLGVLLLVFSKNVSAVTRTQQVTFLCFGNDSDSSLLHFTFRVLSNQDPVIDLVPYDASATTLGVGKKTGCTSVKGDGTAFSPFELTITIDTDDPTSVISLTNTCGIQEITVETLFKFRIRTIGDLKLDLGTDAYYDCQCDVGNLLRGWQTVGPAFVVGLTSLTIQEVRVGAALRLVDKATDLPVSVVELGAEVYLQVVYNPQTQDNNAYDSCGTSFWIVFDSSSPQIVRTYEFYVISATPLTSHVSFWNSSTSNVVDSITVGPSSVARVDVPIEIATGTALLVTATEKVYLMAYISTSGAKSIATVYPADTLGDEYYLSSADFAIVITKEDDTRVEVTSTSYPLLIDGVSISGGYVTPNNINKFDVIHITSNNSLLSTIITSTKPVAVFMGFDTSLSSNNYRIEQATSLQKLGTSFIVPSGFGDVQCVAIRPGTTDIWFPSNQTGSSDNFIQLNQHGTLTLTTEDASFIEVRSSEAVLCTKYYRDSTVTSIPPIQQWSTFYVLDVDSADIGLAFIYIVILNGTESELLLNQERFTAQSTEVQHLISDSNAEGLVAMNVSLPVNIALPVTVSHPSQPFLALLVLNNGSQFMAATVLPGIHLSDLFLNGDPWCSQTSGYRGDLVDNDCDGWVDEETESDTGNPYPDLPATLIDNLHPVRVRPVECVAKPNDVWLDEDISKMIIQTSGCLPTGRDVSPFTPSSTFNMTSDQAPFPVVYNTGSFYMPRFENQADVYMRCRLEFCFHSDDSSCTTDLCQGRRRRNADSDSGSQVIGLHVTVTGKQLNKSGIPSDSADSVQEYCLEDRRFLGVIGVLGFLTLTALSITLYLYCRVQRRYKQ
ncbi:uncharacterized protein [Argopecten irradians]|uniref:uncharacterized protein n=1 Tax=Argopecten irradians TaxID=31199 RepID=UPI003714F87B